MSPRAARQPKVRPPAPDALDARWRLFLAVPLPEQVKALVAEEITSLGAEGWPVRWAPPEGAHLTLHFLGETEQEQAALLRLAMPDVVARHASFDLRTAALGVFPNFRHPRVLWLGLHGPVHRLEALAANVGQTVRELGFPGTDEPYHPHITLGRVRNNDGDKVRLRDLPSAVKERFVNPETGAAIAPPALPVPVHEVVLMRSHLGKGGARYEPIASFPLAGGSP